MKQFSFKLDPVLAYRKLIEDGEKHKLGSIQAAIDQAMTTRDDIGTRIEQCSQTFEARSQGTLDIEELRNLSAHLNHLRQEMIRASQMLSRLERDHKAQLASLLEARQGREAVEKLKENSFSLYKKETQALEQKMLEELSVTRFGRLQEQDLPRAKDPTRRD